ncbi:MAG: class I SAM-dependent methyltransferase [Hyphomicrobiaceae bacterium]|nr:class I SAM-dependent methyltransferase [Hyphomicrobiaceae bacterium]
MHDDLNLAAREVWDRKADFWDARMGDGNLFQRELIGPASEHLLGVQPGELILEIACGNGVFSRRMADLGARVVATDFSVRFLELARARETDRPRQIDYHLVDATDERALAALGEARFDAAVCNMGLMDMATIDPLMHALKRLLKPGGRFVFSVLHPAFNIGGVSVLGLEQEDRSGHVVTTSFVKLHQYLNVPPLLGAGMPDEPEPHLYFHRPLSALLGAAFAAGLVLDGLHEPALAPSDDPHPPFGWSHLPDIPPVLVARLRPRESVTAAVSAKRTRI